MLSLHGAHLALLDLAYLDGGTGSMLIQAAIAGVVSAGFVLKTRWALLKTVISSKFKHPNDQR